jgi:hydrogenase nickel incorporation protein HypA/HybF
MHEMALSESMMEIIAAEAQRHNVSRVQAVVLEIGALASVDAEAMRFCFDAVSRGTVAEGARLDIVRVPGEAWCMPCSRSVPLAERYDPCPRCGSHQLQVIKGEELRVKELEVA